jgi:hypothetical protein
VSFQGEVTEMAEDGSFVAEGVLFGNFGIDENEDVEAHAIVEGFAKDSAIAFVQFTVERRDGGATFAANLRPNRDAEMENSLRGLAFIGHHDANLD